MGEILNKKIEDLKLDDEALQQVSGGKMLRGNGKATEPLQVLEMQCSCGQKIRFTARATSVRCKFCGKLHEFVG